MIINGAFSKKIIYNFVSVHQSPEGLVRYIYHKISLSHQLNLSPASSLAFFSNMWKIREKIIILILSPLFMPLFPLSVVARSTFNRLCDLLILITQLHMP